MDEGHEGHKIWYSTEDSKYHYGVAFIIQKEVVVVLFAALSFLAESSPSGSQRDYTTSHSFRSVHQPQTKKTRRPNSSTRSIIVS